MGQIDINEPIHGKTSTDRYPFSIYLTNTGTTNDNGNQNLPSSRCLLKLKKDLKEFFVKIQTKRNTLEQELCDIQIKYKECLSPNKDTDENILSQKSRQLDESIEKQEMISEQKTSLEQTSHDSSKDNVELHESPKPLVSDKEYVYDEMVHTSDFEKLKKQLGVSYLPTVDLSDKFLGAPVNEDFSKVKAPTQISISTYYAYLDPFYRHFSEDDLVFLKEKDDELATYMIPPLGIFSENAWASEDVNNAISDYPPISSVPYGSPDQLTDEHLYTEEISCGPLLERLLSAILKEENIPDDEPKADENENDTDMYGPDWKIPGIKANYQTFEEKLKKELKYVGILDDDDINWNNREDDEISSNLRSLQNQLRRQSAINSARKNKLFELIKEHLAYQEYSIVLNNFNKQVEQAFLKRSRSIEAKKKRVIGGANSSDNGLGKIGLSNHIQTLLERRKKWIEKVGSIFMPIEKYTRIPTDTIYNNLDNIKTENIYENDT